MSTVIAVEYSLVVVTEILVFVRGNGVVRSSTASAVEYSLVVTEILFFVGNGVVRSSTVSAVEYSLVVVTEVLFFVHFLLLWQCGSL